MGKRRSKAEDVGVMLWANGGNCDGFDPAGLQKTVMESLGVQPIGFGREHGSEQGGGYGDGYGYGAREPQTGGGEGCGHYGWPDGTGEGVGYGLDDGDGDGDGDGIYSFSSMLTQND